MSDLKPVRCGCGGEAMIDAYLGDLHRSNLYYIYCAKCDIRTSNYLSEAEAITAWNKAMGASAEPERKKGEWIEYPDCLRYEGAYNDDHIVCSECGHVFSICDNCTEEFDFCPHCGSDMRGE